ncbi:MAG: DMT family transporter [Alphaproteobacteria bacterium]
MSFPRAPSLVLGTLAALASVAIGAGWQVATRLGTTTTLDPLDLALFRYLVPALVLAPIWLRRGLVPQGASPGVLAILVAGAGLPFGLIAMVGARYAPVAHMGVLLPATMPLFVAMLSAFAFGETFSGRRRIGFVLIVAGVTAIGLPALADRSTGAWRGDALFLLAALLWSIYTVAYRRSGLDPWTAAATVSAWSATLVLPLWLLGGGERIAATPPADLAFQVMMQGIVAGIGGLAIYAIAVRNLGPTRAATSGALVPAAAALGGHLVLGETIDWLSVLGIAAAASGVALAAGVLDRPARPPSELRRSPARAGSG